MWTGELLLHDGRVQRRVKDWRQVVDVVHVDHHRRRLLIQAVRGYQSEFVLRQTTSKAGRVRACHATQKRKGKDLEHALRQVPVVLLGDLGAVRGSLEGRRVVVHVLHVDHHRRVVLLEVVGRRQPQLVLRTTHATQALARRNAHKHPKITN